MNDLDVFTHFFKRLGEFPAVKIPTGIFLWVCRLLYGTFRPAYGAVIVLWLIDTATGYYHARANRAIMVESRKMYHGLIKLLIYFGLLMLGHQCSVIEATAFIQTIIESAIILTESYSIMENLQKISVMTGVKIPWLDRVMKVVQGKIDKLDGGR